jgi:PRTRC genetic system protein E
MFTELTPLLSDRTVLITVAREGETMLRVNVFPKVKESENPALATPLSYTGTPEELDREFGKHLSSFVESHAELGSTLAQAKAEMEAAAKAAQQEARKKREDRAKNGGGKTTANQAVPSAPAAATPSTPAKALPQNQQPATGSAEGGNPNGGESQCRLAL